MNLPLDYARGLLSRARDDFFVVRRLSVAPDAPGWVLGFHAEQAVETKIGKNPLNEPDSPLTSGD